MKRLIFSTGNTDKFLTARHVCEPAGIVLEQRNIDIVEIQAEDPQDIALDKATKAFAAVGEQPVVITDDSWAFSGLKGFPGAYMHSMNEWLSAEDFLRLVAPLEDRLVTMTQRLVFTDGTKQKAFHKETTGQLLTESRGTSTHPVLTIIAFDGDDGKSIAEAFEQTNDQSGRGSAQVWHEFVDWYLNQ